MSDERFPVVTDTTPWWKKNPYLKVEDDPAALIVEGNRVTRGVRETLTNEAVEEIRQGYRCLMCKEPFHLHGAYPKACPLCGFPVREKQPDLFQKLYIGEGHVGPSVNLRDEIDRLDDELERDNWAEHPTIGIIVPR